MSYLNRKLLREVENLQSEALDILRPLIGDRNPETLFAMRDLAKTYVAQCQVEKAEAMCLQVLKGIKSIFGNDYSNTIIIKRDLARIYRIQGRYHEAEVFGCAAFESSKRAHGKDDALINNSIMDLLPTLMARGRYEDAMGLVTPLLDLPMHTLHADPSVAKMLRQDILLWRLAFRFLCVRDFATRTLFSLNCIFVIIILEVWLNSVGIENLK